MILVPKEDSFHSDSLFSKQRTTNSSKKHESASPIKSKRKVFDLKSNLMHSNRKNLEYLDFLASTNNLKDPHLSSSNAQNSNIKIDYEKNYKFKNNNDTFSFPNHDNNIKNNLKNCENHTNAMDFKHPEYMYDSKTNYHADFFISSNEKKNLGRTNKRNDNSRTNFKNNENINSDNVFVFNTENTSNFGFAIPEEDEFEEEGEEIARGNDEKKKQEEESDNERGMIISALILCLINAALFIYKFKTK